MNVSPIPVELLPDDMTVWPPDPTAPYEGEYLDPLVIRRVRVESAEALSPTYYKLADGAKGRAFIDAVNSGGAFGPETGSKVEVRGRDYTVLSCIEFRPFGAVHHWEVDLG